MDLVFNIKQNKYRFRQMFYFIGDLLKEYQLELSIAEHLKEFLPDA